MSAVLKIIDQIPGAGKRTAPDLTLASERITAADLIRRRVETEVAAWNASQDEVFQGLIQPSDSESVLNGYRPKNTRKLNAKIQVEVALLAFKSNSFVLLFDDRQIADPDEELVVTADSEAAFVKLVPLVGG